MPANVTQRKTHAKKYNEAQRKNCSKARIDDGADETNHERPDYMLKHDLGADLKLL